VLYGQQTVNGNAAPPPNAPSGEQFELAHRDQRAVVVEVGGGLRSYSVSGWECLDGYAVDEMCRSGRGQVLIPWPNRLQDGSYEFEGRSHQLALTEPEAQNAIHGLVRWAPWDIAERERHRVAMSYDLHPQPGYPFSLVLRIEYELSDGGLSVRTTATNVGGEACPFGAGAHPYLTVGTPTVDPLTLRVPAAALLETDERGLPVGTKPVDGTDRDFRRARPIGTTVLDNAFTDLERGRDGFVRVDVLDPASGRALTLWADESYPFLQVFTGDPLPDVDRRSLAVEPMTCPPNAFRSGERLIRLDPGCSFTGAWGIVPKG
jgi:aldose 1-epimerase